MKIQTFFIHPFTTSFIFIYFCRRLLRIYSEKHTVDDLILLVSVSKRVFLKNNLLEFIVYFQFFLADFLDFTECKEVNLDGLNNI